MAELGVDDGEPSSPLGKCTRDELGVAGCGIATVFAYVELKSYGMI